VSITCYPENHHKNHYKFKKISHFEKEKLDKTLNLMNSIALRNHLKNSYFDDIRYNTYYLFRFLTE
jgi:hypothetical protein